MFFFSVLMYKTKPISQFNRGQQYFQIDTLDYYFLHAHIFVNLLFYLSFSVFLSYFVFIIKKERVRSNY